MLCSGSILTTRKHDVFALELCSAAGRSVGEGFERGSMKTLGPGKTVELGLTLRVESVPA